MWNNTKKMLWWLDKMTSWHTILSHSPSFFLVLIFLIVLKNKNSNSICTIMSVYANSLHFTYSIQSSGWNMLNKILRINYFSHPNYFHFFFRKERVTTFLQGQRLHQANAYYYPFKLYFSVVRLLLTTTPPALSLK